MLELATLLPVPFSTLVGHVLPLAIALACLVSILPKRITTESIVWTAVVALGTVVMLHTSQILSGKTPDGRFFAAVAMHLSIPTCLAGVAVMLYPGRISSRAAFAAAFFPLWLADVWLGHHLLGWTPNLLRGVGGAGIVDALLLGPVLAVIVVRVTTWEMGRIRKRYG